MSNFLINIFNTGEIVETGTYATEQQCIDQWEGYIETLENECNAPYQIGVSSYSITPYNGPL
jgi:hypothetical protein